MRYIDSEKLVAEIKRLHKAHSGKYGCDEVGVNLEYLEDFIDSLQQEQPFPRWIHANYSDKPEIRHTPSGNPYLQNGHYMIWLSDLETLPKDRTDLINPVPELPEVDMWKEIHKYFNPHGMALQFDRSKGNTIFKPEQLFKFARHFYELGINTRKK